MRTTILAYLIAFVGLVMIAAGVWDFSNLEAETGETLALSDYAPAVQTIAEGLVMLGVAQALRLLLVVVTLKEQVSSAQAATRDQPRNQLSALNSNKL